MSANVPPYSSTRLTAQIGLILSVMLALLFVSGAFFFLYVFNYDAPPWFTPVRVIHFYVGIASIPFLLAKYGTTSFRLAGYYLRVPRFKAAGPPSIVPRLLSPLLALSFFALYFSGLYMLFHYYYTVTNIWPLGLKPVQLHLWAALVAAPLITIHLLWHLVSAVRSVAADAPAMARVQPYAETPAGKLTRRSLLAGMSVTGAGLAFVFQNTPARSFEAAGLFIGRIPKEEHGGPGDFPVETLFGKNHIENIAAYRLKVDGEVDNPLDLSYEEILSLPAHEHTIRISCVSGWTQVVVWKGPRVRDVLALAKERANVESVGFHSLTNYGWTWPRGRLNGDKALLATHQNGAPLSENHGYPVRLIVPGYPGENMIKQIDHLYVQGNRNEFNPDFQLR
ncbi:MAG: molybdopterin-dependent oxidoreductase [Tepidiformaceae bacterium]